MINFCLSATKIGTEDGIPMTVAFSYKKLSLLFSRLSKEASSDVIIIDDSNDDQEETEGYVSTFHTEE